MRLRHVALVSALMATVGLLSLAPAAADNPLSQSAILTFQDPVLVNGTFVMGKVKIVHDEERMARGEPCTQLFRLEEGKAPKELVAVHCKRVGRPVANQLTLVMRTTNPSYRILTAYQFAGTDHAHELVISR
jgi:hypothetical protein